MKKDNYKTYSISAFKVYSACGKPCIHELEDCPFSGPFIEDLAAVGRTIEYFEGAAGGEDVLACLREVYFTHPEELDEKGTVTLRVRRASQRLSISEAGVYRNLHNACLVFARIRGLRISEEDRGYLDLFTVRRTK